MGIDFCHQISKMRHLAAAKLPVGTVSLGGTRNSRPNHDVVWLFAGEHQLDLMPDHPFDSRSLGERLPSHVWSEEDSQGEAERMVCRHRLDVDHIRGVANAAALAEDRIGVSDTTTGHVDDQRAVGQCVEELVVGDWCSSTKQAMRTESDPFTDPLKMSIRIRNARRQRPGPIRLATIGNLALDLAGVT